MTLNQITQIILKGKQTKKRAKDLNKFLIKYVKEAHEKMSHIMPPLGKYKSEKEIRSQHLIGRMAKL